MLRHLKKGGGKYKNFKLIFLRIDDDELLKNVKPFGLRLKTCKILN